LIAIIDYKAGNLASVSNALTRIGAEHVITFDKKQLNDADAIIFPGVGHAQAAMNALSERNLVDWLRETRKPVLGICLGMQLLYESSEEGDAQGLGILPGQLLKFDEKRGKVPHLGWNDFADFHQHPLLAGLSPANQMYYVHSYYAPVTDDTIASCDYQLPFASVCGRDNFLGVQFHPEKSGANGEVLLKNFLKLTQNQR
jgi:imidazole glycerol-phosphate synthase subunit HisH